MKKNMGGKEASILSQLKQQSKIFHHIFQDGDCKKADHPKIEIVHTQRFLRDPSRRHFFSDRHGEVTDCPGEGLGAVDVSAQLDPHVVAQQLQRYHVHDALQRPVRDGDSHGHELGTVDVGVI